MRFAPSLKDDTGLFDGLALRNKDWVPNWHDSGAPVDTATEK